MITILLKYLISTTLFIISIELKLLTILLNILIKLLLVWIILYHNNFIYSSVWRMWSGKFWRLVKHDILMVIKVMAGKWKCERVHMGCASSSKDVFKYRHNAIEKNNTVTLDRLLHDQTGIYYY